MHLKDSMDDALLSIKYSILKKLLTEAEYALFQEVQERINLNLWYKNTKTKNYMESKAELWSCFSKKEKPKHNFAKDNE